MGRPVRQWLTPAAALNVSDVLRGIYLLQVECPSGLHTRRVVLE